MKMLIIIGIFIVGIVYHVECQSSLSLPEPLFSRGCRAQRGQFAHETYCWQYYNCWDGRATIEECPGRLHFNQVIGQCDYAEQVNCGNRLRNPDPSVTADGRCLKQFGIFPDQTDCTAFYECSFGRAYRQVCPYYTAFDERFSVCVHAHEVDCGGRGGIYGTLSPPLYGNDVGGNLPLINLPGSGPAASGFGRRPEPQGPTPFSTSIRRLTPSPNIGIGNRRSSAAIDDANRDNRRSENDLRSGYRGVVEATTRGQDASGVAIEFNNTGVGIENYDDIGVIPLTEDVRSRGIVDTVLATRGPIDTGNRYRGLDTGGRIPVTIPQRGRGGPQQDSRTGGFGPGSRTALGGRRGSNEISNRFAGDTGRRSSAGSFGRQPGYRDTSTDARSSAIGNRRGGTDNFDTRYQDNTNRDRGETDRANRFGGGNFGANRLDTRNQGNINRGQGEDRMNRFLTSNRRSNETSDGLNTSGDNVLVVPPPIYGIGITNRGPIEISRGYLGARTRGSDLAYGGRSSDGDRNTDDNGSGIQIPSTVFGSPQTAFTESMNLNTLTNSNVMFDTEKTLQPTGGGFASGINEPTEDTFRSNNIYDRSGGRISTSVSNTGNRDSAFGAGAIDSGRAVSSNFGRVRGSSESIGGYRGVSGARVTPGADIGNRSIPGSRVGVGGTWSRVGNRGSGTIGGPGDRVLEQTRTGIGSNSVTGVGRGTLPIIRGDSISQRNSSISGSTSNAERVPSRGGHAGITGIVDKDISPTDLERQYEKPISPEASFRCPQPRGLYPSAVDCTRFWLCREYKPSLLKCPTGQLFDLASLSCTYPEKAQCSSLIPRT